MRLIKNIKGFYAEALKTHPFSIITFFIAALFKALTLNSNKGALGLIVLVFTGLFLGSLLCESLHHYQKDNPNYNWRTTCNLAIYSAILIVPTIIFLTYWIINNVKAMKKLFGNAFGAFNQLALHMIIISFVVAICLSVYFLYKKSKDSFEVFLAKAFPIFFKAIAIPSLCTVIAYVVPFYLFNIYSVSIPDVFLILVGLVFFPWFITNISKTTLTLSALAKGIFTYVLPGFYIIIITFMYGLGMFEFFSYGSFFDDNYTSLVSYLYLLTPVFLLTWTAAQGVCDAKYLKFFQSLPYFFIPAVIIKAGWLFGLILSQGFNYKRYLGLAVFIFEIIYYILQSRRIIKDKDVMVKMLFVIMAGTYIMFFIPVISMDSLITYTQGEKITTFFEDFEDADSFDGQPLYYDVSTTYGTIKDYGGFAGYNFIYNKLQPDELEILETYYYRDDWDEYDYYGDEYDEDSYSDEDYGDDYEDDYIEEDIEEEDVYYEDVDDENFYDDEDDYYEDDLDDEEDYPDEEDYYDAFDRDPNTFYACASLENEDFEEIDLSKFDHMYDYGWASYNSITLSNVDLDDLDEVVLFSKNNISTGTISIKNTAKKILDIDSNYSQKDLQTDADYDKYFEKINAALKDTSQIKVSTGGLFIIKKITLFGSYNPDTKDYSFETVEIYGCYLK